MAWLEQSKDQPEASRPLAAREKELEKSKEEGLPIVRRQVAKGELPIKQVKLQPVRSPGLYEGEFGQKDGDIIFHFWPYGYNEAQRQRLASPHFRPNFEKVLTDVMAGEFGGHRVVITNDADVGAYSVIAKDWAAQQFHFEISVRACEKLHKALGGT
jgi:hypothetical protein